MKKAGIREARQNLSALIEAVHKGHEITITDRGRAVARLVPPRREETKTFAGRAAFRRTLTEIDHPLSAAVIEDRTDRP
jgi:prevent-host-death family protein